MNGWNCGSAQALAMYRACFAQPGRGTFACRCLQERDYAANCV